MCYFHYDPPPRFVEFMIIITGITFHSRMLTCLTGIFEHIIRTRTITHIQYASNLSLYVYVCIYKLVLERLYLCSMYLSMYVCMCVCMYVLCFKDASIEFLLGYMGSF